MAPVSREIESAKKESFCSFGKKRRTRYVQRAKLATWPISQKYCIERAEKYEGPPINRSAKNMAAGNNRKNFKEGFFNTIDPVVNSFSTFELGVLNVLSDNYGRMIFSDYN